jgi:hypothetical protein
VAVCAALLLISRSGGGSSESKPYELKGTTSRGKQVSLKVVDGRVEDFKMEVGVLCPALHVWQNWEWAGHGPFGGEGKRFEYGDRNRFPDGGKFISIMRGELTGDGSQARGTVDTRGSWPMGGGRTPCQSSISFDASKAG